MHCSLGKRRINMKFLGLGSSSLLVGTEECLLELRKPGKNKFWEGNTPQGVLFEKVECAVPIRHPRTDVQ